MPGFTVLVPLDTTAFAESALLALPILSRLGFTKARLVSVADKKQEAKADRGNGQASLSEYLRGKAESVQAHGFEVETEVLSGDAAEAILAASAKPDVDLVLIATHGRTGIARLRLGSVGERIIKDAACPRLVIGPNVAIDLESYSLDRILVPLDGSEAAELSLPIARHIARQSGAQIDLLRSVSVTPIAGDPAVGAVDLLTPALEGAEQYLNTIAAGLGDFNVTTQVVTGSPGASILEHLREHPVDLVVLCSRGHTGLRRIAMGSVAEEVLQGPDPVLVFEPDESRSRLFEAARATT
jgi:nucleotide-binding universal stress UspA family protein